MKKKRDKNTKNKWIVGIFLAVILFLIASSYILNHKTELTLPEKIIKDTMNSIYRVIVMPFTSSNEDKKDDNLLNDPYIEELKKEINDLKTQIDIDYTLGEFEIVNASVITRNDSYWYDTITIDKGSSDGITKNSIVINKQGLIGKIASVSNNTSEVKLISTYQNRVSVFIKSKTENISGILNGYDIENNCFLFESSNSVAPIEVGDIVVTNGLGGIYPSGIYVGSVETILDEDKNGIKKLCIKSDVDFNSIYFVSVLKKGGIKDES